MKRYALFVGDDYYPEGGWNDFVGFFETASEAKAAAACPGGRSGWWFNVADLHTGGIVATGGGDWKPEPRSESEGPFLTGEEEALGYISPQEIRRRFTGN